MLSNFIDQLLYASTCSYYHALPYGMLNRPNAPNRSHVNGEFCRSAF